MEQEVVISKKSDVQSAVNELCSKLHKNVNSYQAIIFLAAITYDFLELSKAIKEKFPNSEVIGTSTAGEVTPDGFTNNSVVLTTLSDSSTKIKGFLVENGSKYPITSKNKIEKAIKDCGIRINDSNSGKDAFAIAFINGVFNAEESILSNFYSIIKNDSFPLAGGTAGFTGSEAKTFVSYNGEVTKDGAAFLLIKTRCKFDIRQEDIFNSTGKSFLVTEADVVNRTILKFDGRPAKTVYAEKLGVSETSAESLTFENPFGRFLNGALHIAALAGFSPDKKISLFARVVPNSTLELMHIGDPLQKCDETCTEIKKEIHNPKFTLMMTCITRTIAFERMHISNEIISKYNKTFPTFAGFSAYGEQLGRIHCNQTLVTVVIGD